MNKEMQTLVEIIKQTPVVYLGRGYYYSMTTDILYAKIRGKLVQQK